MLQQASVVITPTDGGRQYALTVPKPGAFVTPGTNQLAAGTATGSDVVEVSRVYTFTPGATPDTGSFDAAVLNEHNGMHLPATRHIPVRTFQVTVVNTFPMLDGAEPLPTSTAVTARVPTQHGFLLVPVNVTNGLTLTCKYPGATPPGITDPISVSRRSRRRRMRLSNSSARTVTSSTSPSVTRPRNRRNLPSL